MQKSIFRLWVEAPSLMESSKASDLFWIRPWVNLKVKEKSCFLNHVFLNGSSTYILAFSSQGFLIHCVDVYIWANEFVMPNSKAPFSGQTGSAMEWMASRKLSLVTENPFPYGNSSTVHYLFWCLKNRCDREPLQSGKKRQEKVREANLGKVSKKKSAFHSICLQVFIHRFRVQLSLES